MVKKGIFLLKMIGVCFGGSDAFWSRRYWEQPTAPFPTLIFPFDKKDQRRKDFECAVLEKGLWPNLGAHHQVLCWNAEMWRKQT